jgi:hypothetical protein
MLMQCCEVSVRCTDHVRRLRRLMECSVVEGLAERKGVAGVGRWCSGGAST